MDALTLEGMKKFLPDPTTYSENEYCHYSTAVDKTNDNKRIKTISLFKKDDSGTKWIYITTETEKEPT